MVARSSRESRAAREEETQKAVEKRKSQKGKGKGGASTAAAVTGADGGARPTVTEGVSSDADSEDGDGDGGDVATVMFCAEVCVVAADDSDIDDGIETDVTLEDNSDFWREDDAESENADATQSDDPLDVFADTWPSPRMEDPINQAAANIFARGQTPAAMSSHRSATGGASSHRSARAGTNRSARQPSSQGAPPPSSHRSNVSPSVPACRV